MKTAEEMLQFARSHGLCRLQPSDDFTKSLFKTIEDKLLPWEEVKLAATTISDTGYYSDSDTQDVFVITTERILMNRYRYGTNRVVLDHPLTSVIGFSDYNDTIRLQFYFYDGNNCIDSETLNCGAKTDPETVRFANNCTEHVFAAALACCDAYREKKSFGARNGIAKPLQQIIQGYSDNKMNKADVKREIALAMLKNGELSKEQFAALYKWSYI